MLCRTHQVVIILEGVVQVGDPAPVSVHEHVAFLLETRRLHPLQHLPLVEDLHGEYLPTSGGRGVRGGEGRGDGWVMRGGVLGLSLADLYSFLYGVSMVMMSNTDHVLPNCDGLGAPENPPRSMVYSVKKKRGK